MKPLQITAFLRIKANGPSKPKRFSILAYSGGTLNVDGFPNGVVVDLSGLEIPGSIPILIDHKKTVEATLGLTDNIHTDGKVLNLAGVVTGQSATAQQVIAQAAAGHSWQASIGVWTVEEEEVAAGQTATANGQTFNGPVTIARRSILRETSVLPMGADATTSVNLAASAAKFLKGAAMPTFEEWCASMGLDAATMTPEALAAAQMIHGLAKPAVPATAPVVAPATVVAPTMAPTAAAGATQLTIEAQLAETRRQISAEFHRAGEIRAKATGHDEIIATAIEKGWSLDKVELEVLKKKNLNASTRPTSFSSAQNSPENMPKVLEAALCMTRGITGVEKQYDDKILQAAHSQFGRGIGIQQIILMCAAANGMPIQAGMKVTPGNLKGLLKYACRDNTIEASLFSVASLPGILSNVANKEILQGYMEEDATWREVAQTKSVSNFQAVTSYRLLDDMRYLPLGPGGEIKHGSLGEESYTRQVRTYARMFTLTREMMINDDTGAFDDLRAIIGRGSAIKVNDLFWTAWLANVATIWTTARTNYIEGATTNLGTDGVGLALGVKAFRQMRSPTADGSKRLSRTPKLLLVPPELEVIADQLYTARNATAVETSKVNTQAGKYRPVVVNQLSDSSYTGYSTTAWWLLGDKGMGSPVVVSFLDGQETPTVESADTDFSTLGIQFRGYADVGVDVADYLNSLRSKGAA